MSYVVDRNKTINKIKRKGQHRGALRIINQNFKSIEIALGNIPIALESNYNSTSSRFMKHLRRWTLNKLL